MAIGIAGSLAVGMKIVDDILGWISRDPSFNMLSSMVVIGALAFLHPLRSLVNHWRMLRRQRKYPQIVVCKKNDTSFSGKTIPTSKTSNDLSGLVLFMISELLSASLTIIGFLVVLPLRALRWALSPKRKRPLASVNKMSSPDAVIHAVESPVTISPDARANPPSPRTATLNTEDSENKVSPSTISPAKNTTLPVKPRSVLRRSRSSGISSRVVFTEQSNGAVKTEEHYFNPDDQPNQINPQKSTHQPLIGDATEILEPAPIATPQPDLRRRRFIRRRKPTPHAQPVNTGQEPSSHQENQEVVSEAAQLKGTIDGFGNGMSDENRPTPRRLMPKNISPNNQVSLLRPFEREPFVVRTNFTQTPLSEQMRKRRLEQGDQFTLTGEPASKRRNLGGSTASGRVRLGGTRPRLTSSRRMVLSKREREQREDRILKDLNTKRTKKVEAPPKATLKTNALSGTPAVQFGLSSSSNSTAQATTTAATTNIQFGGAGGSSSTTSTAAQRNQSAGSEAPKLPSISFTSTPLAAPGSLPASTAALNSETAAPHLGQTSNVAASTGTNSSVQAAKPAFSFGTSTSNQVQAAENKNGALPPVSASAPPALSFGGAVATTPAAAPKHPPSANPPAGFSSGGTSNTPAATSVPAINFGSTPSAPTATPSTSTFSFGANQSSTVTPKFGISSNNESAVPPLPSLTYNKTQAVLSGPGAAPPSSGAAARRRAKARSGRRR